MALDQKIPAIVTLNVGGHFFTTRLSTLLRDEDSMLSSMFSGRYQLDVDDQGRYFIDRDGTYFGLILNYLRDSSQLPSSSMALQVYREAQYYRIEGLITQLECYPAVIPIGRLEDQKSTMGENFFRWKQMILETVRKKYGDVLKYSLGQECMITAVRYISNKDYSIAMSMCKNHSRGLSTEDAEAGDLRSHNFFCADEGGNRLGYFIGPEIPLVDLVIPEDEIPDSLLFTSLLEKDLRYDGFCVSGRSSHAWKCSRCDIMGYLHQMAFRWTFAHTHHDLKN